MLYRKYLSNFTCGHQEERKGEVKSALGDNDDDDDEYVRAKEELDEELEERKV